MYSLITDTLSLWAKPSFISQKMLSSLEHVTCHAALCSFSPAVLLKLLSIPQASEKTQNQKKREHIFNRIGVRETSS